MGLNVLFLVVSLWAVARGNEAADPPQPLHSVFQNLAGLKPLRSCTISAQNPQCQGLNKVSGRFHHVNDEGRFTGLQFDVEHHPNLKLLDDHHQVADVQCFKDHLVIKRPTGAAHIFGDHVNYQSEDHFVTGSLLHNCPNGMPIRRRVESVRYLDQNTAHVDTSPAELEHVVKNSNMRFYTNNLAEGADGPAPMVDEIAAGNTPHEYGEYTYLSDGSWGVYRPVPEGFILDADASATDRKLSGFLGHIFHEIGHFFHHVAHAVGHFFHQVGQAIGHFVHAVVRVVKDVVGAVVNLAEFAWDEITGQAYKKSFSKHKTFGWNYNEVTNSAKKPITLNAHGPIPVHCDDCFAEMDFGLDAEFEIKGFHVNSAALTVEGREHVKISANSNVALTVAKSFGPHPILKMNLFHIHFFIGPVPVFIDFDLQVEVGGDLSFTAGAALDTDLDDLRQLKLGWAYKKIPDSWPATGVHQLGGSMSRLVYYNVQSNVGTLNGHAQLDVSVGIYVQPTISVSVDGIIYGSISMKPELTSELHIQEDFHAQTHHLLGVSDQVSNDSPVDRDLNGVTWNNDFVFDFNMWFQLSVGAHAKVKAFGTTFLDRTYNIYDSGLKNILHKHWTSNTGSDQDASATSDDSGSSLDDSDQGSPSTQAPTSGTPHVPSGSSGTPHVPSGSPLKPGSVGLAAGSVPMPLNFHLFALKQKAAWERHTQNQKGFPIHTINLVPHIDLGKFGQRINGDGRALLDNDETPEEEEVTLVFHGNNTIKNTRSVDAVQRSAFVCPRSETCMVARGLVHCDGLNGQRVCATSQEELLEHDAQVGRFLSERRTYGDAAVRSLRAFQCEVAIPICDPVSYEATVTKLCHDECKNVFEVAGIKESVGHSRCLSQSAHHYSPVSEVAGSYGASCKRVSTLYDDVATSEHNACEVARELTHCPEHNGKMIHYDKRQYETLEHLDEFVGKLHKAHQDENEHACPVMTKALVCGTYMPECVKSDDIEVYYKTNNITDAMRDDVDDPSLPSKSFHIILPMCSATCEHHVSSCGATKDSVFDYCMNMADPHVRARFAPPQQQACGHRLPEHALMAEATTNVSPGESETASMCTTENSWKTWQVVSAVGGGSVFSALAALLISHQWTKKQNFNARSEVGLAEYRKFDA